ncbi:3,4-dihydroxy-2-butanone-4-phosphate synthase [Gaoshiqia sediminis]|uniref:3,4-dihydroxy-2-butanone 4-phosphate synthase n=1 Tax=Gaoshiqia sediminis TaxID=2986998 RepID=A0AA42C4H2_9BACT|nr:3,4-dihydroxy-2-butanone-4-phosphate synthase [Gaoshiqia sediminis]MCW0481773.1 3,4-dihydroxy-2-butanone-4-phosphate synthase [Gaoshiqia sediminis]
MTKFQYQDIEDAIEEIKKGNIIIVTDDETRENEGDFIAAVELVTPEIVNFMATHGRGLICAALTEERCTELKLARMVQSNTALNSTNFTVSVDLMTQGCTTGISASDRAKTLNALANPQTKPEELGRPGHIFPIIAHPGGLRERPGHTEATVELARLAGLKPAGALVEIMNPDGTMARYSELLVLAQKHGLKLITIKRLTEYLNVKNL